MIKSGNLVKLLIIVEIVICLLVVLSWRKRKFRVVRRGLIFVELTLIALSVWIQITRLKVNYWVVRGNCINLIVTILSFSFGLVRVII